MKPEIEYRPAARLQQASGGVSETKRVVEVRAPTAMEKRETARPPHSGFDRVTYQREYMQEWRRKRKEVKCLDR